MKKLTWKDYFRGSTSIVWIIIIIQCIGFIFNGSSIIITGLYFIICTCTLGLVILTIDTKL
jgi:hypothetical protein